ISAYQPKSVLLKVLFEPHTFVSDSATYDITAWSLPYAYGLQAFASTDNLKPLHSSAPADRDTAAIPANPVAYITNWNSLADVKFLTELLKNNMRVRFSELPFETEGRRFNAGSLIIMRTGNESPGRDFEKTLNRIADAN